MMAFDEPFDTGVIPPSPTEAHRFDSEDIIWESDDSFSFSEEEDERNEGPSVVAT